MVTPTSGPQSNFVRPKIVFKEPTKSRHRGKGGKYLSAGADGITVTLIASAAGLSGLSATTDLTTACPGGTCTIYGPPIPPGVDTLGVVEYAEEPTGDPLAEPAGAHAVAQTGSTASPPQPQPTPDIIAGTDNTVNITLYGVPAGLSIPDGATTFTADSPSSTSGFLTVEDYLRNPITGEYSAPVTVTDSDSGTLGTSLSLDGGTTKSATVTLNSDTDLGNLVAEYGGIAEIAPTITATSGAVTSGAATPFNITLKKIAITPVSGYAAETQTTNEIDLFAPTGTGSTAQVSVAEAGWSDSPYNKTFTLGTGSCSMGTAAATYSFTTTDNLTFTDTAPVSAAPPAPEPGICTVPITDFNGGQTATETLTYTSTTIGVNAKNRFIHVNRKH